MSKGLGVSFEAKLKAPIIVKTGALAATDEAVPMHFLKFSLSVAAFGRA